MLGDIGEQNCDVKHKQSQLIGMDSVSDICKYHLLCFMTIIEVKVMSGHQVKKVNVSGRNGPFSGLTSDGRILNFTGMP